MSTAQKIVCPHFDSAEIFLAATPTAESTLPYGQPWRPDGLEERFLPAKVRCGWTNDALLVSADLDDISIGNSATAPNSQTWKTGDVFEVFLRPAGGKRYFEFHVTPENVQLQLHFESSEVFFSPEMQDLPEDQWRKIFLLPEESFVSTTQVDHRAHKWQVFTAIPFSTLGVTTPQTGNEWLGCFCRYDSAEGQSDIYSTTGSGSKVANFHDQNTWNPMVFAK